MQIIRESEAAASIANSELRALVEKTIRDLSEDYPYDPEVLGYFLLVETGIDTLDTINKQLGFNVLTNRWTGIRFDQPGYTQSFECLDEHTGYYEMLFIISDDGFGIEVFVPKTTDIADLLAMCQLYAVPAPVPEAI